MIKPGDQVEHEEFGIGQVLALLGETATVEFFGETFDVAVGELLPRPNGSSPVINSAPVREGTDLAFRQSFEAVNLGVVPSNPDQLIKLTIGGDQISANVRSILDDAPRSGASRIFMGYYGSGKSHHLRLVRAIALREGWVTASIELDPKAADPAKPFSVYQELITGLEFPMRSDGSRNEDFFDLIKEIRDKWMDVRLLKYLKASQWFGNGIEALQFLAHRRDDPEYVSAVNWLAGQVKLISAIRKVTWREGYRGKIPTMPQTKDTGLIYAFHLVVLHEVLKALGYRGLALIIDEAEHVRTYSINRYLRANNFFDVLARCAHPPRKDLQDPHCDYDMTGVPPFWREGPHFGLFVGLTEGEDTQDLKRKAGEMSVLIHSPDEVVHLAPPSAADYEAWAIRFLTEASSHLGPKVDLLSDPDLCAQIAAVLRERFEQIPDTEKLLRNWTKMAGLPAAVLLSQSAAVGHNELLAIIDDAAKQISGEVMPWDE
ncbi:MAG: DUF2791 family P-loop domain-containing protein [Rhodobacteraceae bacterium]|nr:DUF2791 family P-loop domain-containing protein [Paracoccaceae bacterium]